MGQVHIIRHQPGAVFCAASEVVLVDDQHDVVRLVEPSGMVGTQYPGGLGSQWFGTIESLSANLALGGARWSDVYKTDVLWTTPGPERAACEQRRDEYNAIYGAMVARCTGGPLRSNRMARFTHPEGFPDPKALFEVQIKAVLGEKVKIEGGRIEYGSWTDHQPSGASVTHKRGDEMIHTLGPDLRRETEFVFEEHYAKPLAQAGVDFRKQTVWMELLVAVDDAPGKTWERIETVRQAFAEYFGEHRPAGLIYPVSRIPNLDGIVEPQPRVVSGEVEIARSGQLEDGFSTWTAIRHRGIAEVMASAIGGQDAGAALGTIDARIKAAGGSDLREDGVFNNAYVVAGGDSAANRAALQKFNASFSAYYQGSAPPGRTTQFIGGIQRQGHACGISSRALFAA